MDNLIHCKIIKIIQPAVETERTRAATDLGLADAVPDGKTLWLYREALAKAGAVEELFNLFDGYLKATSNNADFRLI